MESAQIPPFAIVNMRCNTYSIDEYVTIFQTLIETKSVTLKFCNICVLRRDI